MSTSRGESWLGRYDQGLVYVWWWQLLCLLRTQFCCLPARVLCVRLVAGMSTRSMLEQLLLQLGCSEADFSNLTGPTLQAGDLGRHLLQPGAAGGTAAAPTGVRHVTFATPSASGRHDGELAPTVRGASRKAVLLPS